MQKKDLWDGKQYKDNSSPQEKSAVNIINSICFKEDDSILDIGCGDGKVTQILCSLTPYGQTVGIDPSNSMISEANKTASSYGNLSFFEASAEDFANETAENLKRQSIRDGVEDKIEFKAEMLVMTACKKQ